MIPTSAQAAIRTPQRLARETGARYLLAGKIARQGARLRIILRAADATTGHHIWGDSFDGTSDQPLELEDRIVAGVLRSLISGIRDAVLDRASRVALLNFDSLS